MDETTEFKIGSEVACRDGYCGDLRRVVVDPVVRTLTHLVVEAKHWQGTGRLVPIEEVVSTLVTPPGGEIRLRCILSEFAVLEDAEETKFLPGLSGGWGYGQGQVLSWPYFGLGMGMSGECVGGMGFMGEISQLIISDRVPVGEAEVQRGDHVHAMDGDIGRVQGLVIDPGDHRVTHLLLDAGCLLSHRPVAIPMSSVQDVDDGVWLNLTKNDVRDLPPVPVDRPE